MRKKLTDEEKKAWGAKMKAAREAKRRADLASVRIEQDPPQTKANLDVDDLQRQIEELKQSLAGLKNLPPTPQSPQGPIVTSRGIVGVQEKYVMDPDFYPDPTGRLRKEAKLKPFAFEENFELTYECAPIRPYETKDGRLVTEPQFTLRLIRKVRDEETNELTNQRYVLRKGVFFEDPQTAVIVARDNGIDFTKVDERTFLDEMRYLRFRDWLFDGFFPPKSDRHETNKHEVVIGNRLVEVYETSSETPQNIKAKLGEGLF